MSGDFAGGLPGTGSAGTRSVTLSSSEGSAALAIAAGGFIAGSVDILQACILFGWDIPKVIAAGLLGPGVIKTGGAGIYILGLVLHYFIACSAAGIYYGASRKLRFLAENWIVCGLFFGMAVEIVMSDIVLPLSALHATHPRPLNDVLLGLGVHMVVVGLPIAYSVKRWGR